MVEIGNHARASVPALDVTNDVLAALNAALPTVADHGAGAAAAEAAGPLSAR